MRMKPLISLLLVCFSYLFIFKLIQLYDTLLFVVTLISDVSKVFIYDSLCPVKLFLFYLAFSLTTHLKTSHGNYVSYQQTNMLKFKSQFLYVFFVKKYSVVAKNCLNLQNFDGKNALIFVISLLIDEIKNFFLSFP